MQTRIGAKLGYSYFFLINSGTCDVSVRVESIGGTMLKMEQRVSRNFQYVKAIYCLGLTTSERASKLKGL